MRFMVEEKVFEALPDMCVGVVVAKGADNSVENAAVAALLDEAIALAE